MKITLINYLPTYLITQICDKINRILKSFYVHNIYRQHKNRKVVRINTINIEL